MLDFLSLIKHQLWDHFEICCQALAYLKPNSLELTQRLQHWISNIWSDFPYIQEMFQEQGTLQMVENDMEDLHSQAFSTKNSYREGTLKLQALWAQEEALLKSLADIQQKFQHQLLNWWLLSNTPKINAKPLNWLLHNLLNFRARSVFLWMHVLNAITF